MSKHYVVNEIFGPTLQGEGVRAGTVAYWLRFAGCNQTCKVETHGFDCDTDFSGGRKLELHDIGHELFDCAGDEAKRYGFPEHSWVVLSGGEPMLQADAMLLDGLRDLEVKIAMETNGSIPVPKGKVDWLTVSPKTAEHTLRACDQGAWIDELKYVRAAGQALPKPKLKASHYLISPAFEPTGELRDETLRWCIKLCMENPRWRLSVQLHKLLGLR